MNAWDLHSVMNPWLLPSAGKAVCVDRASPKSHTLRSQLALSKRLDGFKSRWMTLGEEGRVSLSRLDLRKRERGEGKGKKGKTQTYFQQNAKPSKLYMFGIRNIDNGRRSGLGFGSRDEDLFREVLGRGRLFRFHSQNKRR